MKGVYKNVSLKIIGANNYFGLEECLSGLDNGSSKRTYSVKCRSKGSRVLRYPMNRFMDKLNKGCVHQMRNAPDVKQRRVNDQVRVT